MPTVLYIDGFRIVIRTDDHPPPHVHVFRSGGHAKVYLDSLEVAAGSTLGRRDETKVRAIMASHAAEIWQVWRELHG